MVYVFLANGFEEIEALAVVDILRRAKINVATVSILESKLITGAHGIPVLTDKMLSEINMLSAEVLVLPGGMPGAANLDECDELCEGLVKAYEKGIALAAICAAPMILGRLGLLDDKIVSCYPTIESELETSVITQNVVEEDFNIITACGPAAALDFAFAIVDHLKGIHGSDKLREEMQCNRYYD